MFKWLTRKHKAMKITVNRLYKKDTYTIGKMFLNGEYFCDTIEDKDRGLKQSMLKNDIVRIKVPAQTAIPSGTYKVTLNVYSPKFSQQDFYKKVCGGKLPRLIDVKGFEGVLIHCGTTAEDTAGCLIVGQNLEKGKVLNSRKTFEKLMSRLKGCEDITIEII